MHELAEINQRSENKISRKSIFVKALSPLDPSYTTPLQIGKRVKLKAPLLYLFLI